VEYSAWHTVYSIPHPITLNRVERHQAENNQYRFPITWTNSLFIRSVYEMSGTGPDLDLGAPFPLLGKVSRENHDA
jgi:hypothetical protein